MVKTLPSRAWGSGLIPGWEAKTPQALRPSAKTKNRSNVVTDSIKDFENDPHQKKKSFKKGNAPSRRDDKCRTASFASNHHSGHTPRNNLPFLPFKHFLGDPRVFQVLPVPRNPVQSKGQSAVSICFFCFPTCRMGFLPMVLK